MRQRPFQASVRRRSLLTRLLTGGGTTTGMVAIGDGANGPASGRTLWLNATTPGWFETMGIPLRSGRDFEAGDRMGSLRLPS